jgi:hypothetical protein
MTIALWLLAIQGVIGAFDTIYYHEWRARLPVVFGKEDAFKGCVIGLSIGCNRTVTCTGTTLVAYSTRGQNQ